nr:telomerase-binding protein EST1A-like [Dermatophagoides farinae]
MGQNHNHHHHRSTYYHHNRLTNSNRQNNLNQYYQHQHSNYSRKVNNNNNPSSGSSSTSSNSNYKITKNRHHHHSEDSDHNSHKIMNQTNDQRQSKFDRYEQNLNKFQKSMQTYSLIDQNSVIERFDLPIYSYSKKSENSENRMELIQSINNLVLIDSLRNLSQTKSKSQSTAASSTSSTSPSNIKQSSIEEKPGLIVLPSKTMTSAVSEQSSTIITDKSKMNNKSGSNAGIIRLNRDTMHQLLQRNSMDENTHHHRQQYSHHSNDEHSIIDRSPREKHNNTITSQIAADFYEFENLLDRLRYYGGRQNWRNGPSLQKFCYSDPNIQAIRIRIMNACEHLLLIDLNRSITQNVLPNIWEICFYDFIRIYRQNHGGEERATNSTGSFNEKEIHDTNLLSKLAREGLDYFGTLYHRLIEKYQFQLKSLYERHKYYRSNPSLYSHLHDITCVVKIIFIYLGDLWRYIELVPPPSSSSVSHGNQLNSGHFVNSKNYYMKAHMLVPKNSHICSQLALVSFYQKNYFDAIYYSIISFEYDILHDRCSNRFRSKFIRVQSNRQNLLVYFDSIRSLHMKMISTIRRDYDQTMEREKLQRQRLERGHSRINKNYRIEYWVRPDRTIAKCDMYNFYDLAAVVSRNESEPDLLKFYEKFILKSPATATTTTTTTMMLAKSQFKDLKDRFTLSFLMVHAMLNHRVGLDRFYDVANQMILEFDSVINRSSDHDNHSHNNNRLSPFFLIQLFVINMYSVANTMDDHNRDHHQLQYAAYYGFTQTNSYFIMSTMISMILKRLIHLFETFRHHHLDLLESINSSTSMAKGQISRKLSNEPECIDDCFGSIYHTMITKNPSLEVQQEWFDFYSFLPCVKLWSDWIISFNPYFPPQEMNDIKTPGIDQNVWQIFAQFLTQLHQIKQYPVVFYSDQKSKHHLSLSSPKSSDLDQNEYELVQLPEDRFLDGFKILRDTPESSKFVHTPFVLEIAYIYMRIESIKLFGDYLCGLQYPYLRFDTKNFTFESLINTDDVENQPGIKLKQIQQRQLMEAMNRDKNNQIIANNKSDGDNDDDDDDECYSNDEEAIREMNDLNLNPMERRKLLQYRMFRQQNRQHGRYFRMIEHIHEPKRRFIIIPRYVIFDTNCFINDLHSIMKFVHNKSFIVAVPLIVVQELQSMMARGQRLQVSKSSEDINNDEQQESMNLRYKQLAKKSAEILDCLQKAFDSNVENIRAITSKGSLLDRIDYKEESNDNSNAVNNDDRILYGCVSLVEKDNHHVNDEQIDDKWMRNLLKDAGEQQLTNQDEFIHRNVILITDDMNLRIKSLGYDIPVKKFKQFRKWASTLDNHQPQAQQPSPPLLRKKSQQST